MLFIYLHLLYLAYGSSDMVEKVGAQKSLLAHLLRFEIVPFSKINPNDYMTISIRGVTHYSNGELDYQDCNGGWSSEKLVEGNNDAESPKKKQKKWNAPARPVSCCLGLPSQVLVWSAWTRTASPNPPAFVRACLRGLGRLAAWSRHVQEHRIHFLGSPRKLWVKRLMSQIFMAWFPMASD